MVSASSKTDVYVSNITEKIVENGQQLRALMDAAKRNRATACTVGNERSSRSPYAIMRLQLIGVHVGKQEKCVGTVNLVDLAGSESPKTSTRMEETKKISRSLSELTNVIMAILNKQEHVPYRNFKLTLLLMPALGGNSKTLMVINVSPLQGLLWGIAQVPSLCCFREFHKDDESEEESLLEQCDHQQRLNFFF
ncbi:protein claret segregational-like [Lutzomyia longipalpis]|uniref:protein claret segregational-like n=1 Tax=Lutzomyia longipalpis TaxID=7200 RepID=UPI002483E5FB|nr:protein claret segregational-like [Lutzomyia longipalpis]